MTTKNEMIKKRFEKAREICKNHGIKGFRRLKLQRPIFVAGKQCTQINSHIAKRLIDRLVEEGYTVEMKDTLLELADKGLFDTVSISL